MKRQSRRGLGSHTRPRCLYWGLGQPQDHRKPAEQCGAALPYLPAGTTRQETVSQLHRGACILPVPCLSVPGPSWLHVSKGAKRKAARPLQEFHGV